MYPNLAEQVQRQAVSNIPGADMQLQQKRASQWEVAAKRHAELLSTLHERVKLLADRLHPVLRPTPPQPAAQAGMGKQQEPLAPVAGAMHQICDELENLSLIVDDVLLRLEL